MAFKYLNEATGVGRVGRYALVALSYAVYLGAFYLLYGSLITLMIMLHTSEKVYGIFGSSISYFAGLAFSMALVIIQWSIIFVVAVLILQILLKVFKFIDRVQVKLTLVLGVSLILASVFTAILAVGMSYFNRYFGISGISQAMPMLAVYLINVAVFIGWVIGCFYALPLLYRAWLNKLRVNYDAKVKPYLIWAIVLASVYIIIMLGVPL